MFGTLLLGAALLGCPGPCCWAAPPCCVETYCCPCEPVICCPPVMAVPVFFVEEVGQPVVEKKSEPSTLESTGGEESADDEIVTEEAGFSFPSSNLGNLALDWGSANIGPGYLYPQAYSTFGASGFPFFPFRNNGTAGGFTGSGQTSSVTVLMLPPPETNIPDFPPFDPADPSDPTNPTDPMDPDDPGGPSEVPEPISALTWLVGLGGTYAWRRRKNKKRDVTS